MAAPAPAPRAPSTRVSDPHRRHRRVGDAGGRRQGQGAQGGRAAGRSASAPASPTSRPRTTSSRRPSRPLPRPAQPPLHAGRRPARAAGGDRRRRPRATPGYDVDAGQVLVTNGGKQAVYQAFATLLDPGDEVLLPAPYWTTYPEAIRLAGGVPVEVLADETQDYLVTVDQLEAARTDRDQGAAVLLAVQPDRRGLPAPSRSRRSAAGRSSTASGWSPTRSTSTCVYDGAAGGPSMPVRGARAGRPLRRGQRRRQDLRDDRLAGRLDDRPADVVKAATNLQSHADVERRQRRRSARRSRRSPVTSRRSRRCAQAFDRRRQHDGARCSTRSTAWSARAAGRVLRLPVGQGRARPRHRRAHGPRRRPSWPS